jgi:hypothetical protein
VRAGDLAETDWQFSQVRAGIQKHFVGKGGDEDRAIMRTHAIARKWLSPLSPESRTHASEADTARNLHGDRVTEAARFERGRSCAFLRSRHLCVLHIRVRKVQGEIDTGIFGIRFFPRPGIIF